jgi:hypothetical protein
MPFDPTRLFRGQGVLSIAERDVSGYPLGLTDMGNATQVMLSPSVDRISHRESRSGRMFEDVNIERMIDVGIQFTLESIAAANLRRYMYGSTSQISAATITNEIVTGYLGKRSKLARLPITTFTSLTNAAATLTYSRDLNDVGPVGPAIAATFDNVTDTFTATAHGLTAGQRIQIAGTLPTGYVALTNYFVIAAGLTANAFQISASFGGAAALATTDGAGLTILPQYDYFVNLGSGSVVIYATANLADASSLRANYAVGASQKTSGFTVTNREVYLLFEGLNTAFSDSPVVVECYKCRLDPTDQFQMIMDEFAQYQISGRLLYDTTKPDTTPDGRFFRITDIP